MKIKWSSTVLHSKTLRMGIGGEQSMSVKDSITNIWCHILREGLQQYSILAYWGYITVLVPKQSIDYA